MKNNKSKNSRYIRSKLKARLSFDDGYVEKPIYSIKAFTNEKGKGINMIGLIRDNFNITREDIKEHQQIEFNELTNDFEMLEKQVKDRKKVEFTRDERGQIMSPFGNKARELGKLKR